jgi:hypothetical protein
MKVLIAYDGSSGADAAILMRGARIAGEAGLDTHAVWAADERTVPDLISEEAEELDVDLIILGSRGLTGVRAFLGSVSNHVLQHARRPVLGSSPSEGSEKAPPHVGAFSFRTTRSVSNVRLVWSRLWSFRRSARVAARGRHEAPPRRTPLAVSGWCPSLRLLCG